MKKTLITRINNVDIVATSNEKGDILIPIRPICEALGVAYQPQIAKFRDDIILGSNVTLSVTVGADGQPRETVCLPLQYVSGWLFTINPANVSEEARPEVERYRLECYDALYNRFARVCQLDEYRDEIRLLDEISRAKLRAARLDEQPTLFD